MAGRTERVLLEVCITSVEDARIAAAAGADRLELNAALECGGLTPSLGCLEAVRAAVSVPLIVMIRPRPGGFCYDDDEFRVMCRDAELALRAGADGLAFGILDIDARIDVARCRELVQRTAGRTSVFHRAFDLTPDPEEALEQLIDLGFRRVLTSGQAPTALEGSPVLARLVRRAGGRIEILPAAGIRPENVLTLLAETGCSQVHGSLSHRRDDPSTRARPQISFSADARDAHCFRATDASAVKRMADQLRRLSGSQQF